LRTRPATMLTAIGLCVLIMVIQLVPQIRDIGAGRMPASARPPRDNAAGNARALVRPPGNAHLEGQVARAHVLRQRSGPATRHAAR
jgi:hypothetical protein